MNTISPADKPQNDSILFKLLNMTACFVVQSDAICYVGYLRGDTIYETKVAFEELDAALPGLKGAVLRLESMDLGGFSKSMKLRTSCAFQIGAYRDTRRAGFVGDYYLLSHVTHVYSAHEPGMFIIQGTWFRFPDADNHDFPLADLSNKHQQPVTGEVLESLWPGSTKAIPVMEGLGYASEEIVENLLAGVHSSQPHASSLNMPKFE